jgi:hypothetical protein
MIDQYHFIYYKSNFSHYKIRVKEKNNNKQTKKSITPPEFKNPQAPN